MKSLAYVVIAVVLSPCCFAQANAKPDANADQSSQIEKPETSHLAFVKEYIRELSAIESIRASGEKDLRDKKSSIFSNSIHSGTLFELELRSQIGMLKSMNLKPPFEELIPNITVFYEHKIALWQRITDISSAFMEDPKPDVDYGKLLAELPKIRAQLDYIDHALFEVTPGIFATLIDLRPDSKNHASHLIITKAERAALIADLNVDFGSKLDQKDQNYTVSAAKVLKQYLLKDYKCSDDPWE
jgi:hypothetical protein